MERVKTFTAPTGSTVKAIPAPPIGKLTDYLDYGVACTETSGQSGNYEVTLDDTESKEWLIFLGTSNPTSWDDWYWKFSFDEGPLVEQYDTATMIDTFNRFAVTGTSGPFNAAIADIGLATSGAGNSRIWSWSAGGRTWNLARATVNSINRWRIVSPNPQPQSNLFIGPTVASPLGDYVPFDPYAGSGFTYTPPTGTVAVGKKQIARKAWRYTSAALTVVTPPGDPSPIVIPPGGPGKSTGWALCIGTDGEPVEDKRVYGRIVRGREEAGNVYDGQDFSALSDEDGVVTFEGLIRGARYEFWGLRLGRGKASQVTVPDDESFQIPDLII